MRPARPLALLLALSLPPIASGDAIPAAGEVLGDWTFDQGDGRDSTGRHRLWKSVGVAFRDGCAIFERGGSVEVTLPPLEMKRKFRRLEVEIRVRLDRPEAYYNVLLSHPFIQVGVHSLGSGQGRPCYALATVPSDLAPDPENDLRWGKAAPLTRDSKGRFYYWGWVGDASASVESGTWIRLRTLYDGRRVLQYVDGKPIGTHPVKAPGTPVGGVDAGAAKLVLGAALADEHRQHAFIGRLDRVTLRGWR